jgi:PTS system nitrogen regulatory IIA component
MPFLDLLPAQRIRTDVVAADKAGLLDRLAGLLADPGADREAIHDSLRAREQLGSTGLGRGVAIPHGRIAALDQARAAFVRLDTPLAFDAADGGPVDLVAALVVPLHYTDQHLHLLAELAGMFSDAELTRALRSAPDADALRAELAEFRRRQDKAPAWTD